MSDIPVLEEPAEIAVIEDKEQAERYEAFRRSSFPKSRVRKIMSTCVSGTISPNCLIIMSGLTKVFIGQIVEEAVDIATKLGFNGPIQPRHVALAIDKLVKQEPYFKPGVKKSKCL